jgi:hypothetical protein
MKLLVTGWLLDLFSKFVARMDSKREKDYKKIEKIYQDMTLDQRKQIFAYQRDQSAKKDENLALKRSIHSLKCKLASDFTVITNLRREVEFVREHSRIIEEENSKITNSMQVLFNDLKVLDATSDNLKPHFQAFEQCRELGRMSSDYLTQNYRSQMEAGLNLKQRHELNRMMTQDDLPYEGFMTCDKSCSTANLVSTNTVNVNFLKLSDKKEVAHVGTQKIDLKPRTKDATHQIHIPNWESHRPGSSIDEDSVSNSVYKRKMIDRYKIEHMLVGASDRKSVLVKQTSIVPDTITELMELSHYNDDRQDYFGVSALPSATDVLFPLPKGKGKNHNRSGRVSFSLKPPQRADTLKFPSAEKSDDRQDKSESRVSVNFSTALKNLEKKNTTKEKSSIQKLRTASNRLMASQRTINSFKPEIGSPNESTGSAHQLDKSPRTLVEMDHLETYREAKLRNELIRQKQQFKTLGNRLAGCEADPEKAAHLQAMLDSAAVVIDKLEKQLKTFKKTSDLAERMSQFRPAQPPVIVSKFGLHRTKNRRAERYKSRAETQQLHARDGQQGRAGSGVDADHRAAAQEEGRQLAQGREPVLQRLHRAVRKSDRQGRHRLPHDAAQVQHVQNALAVQLQRQGGRKPVSQGRLI